MNSSSPREIRINPWLVILDDGILPELIVSANCEGKEIKARIFIASKFRKHYGEMLAGRFAGFGAPNRAWELKRSGDSLLLTIAVPGRNDLQCIHLQMEEAQRLREALETLELPGD